MSVVPASDVEDKAAATAAAAPVVVAAAPVIVVAPVVATEAVVTHDIMAVEGVFVKQKIELLELATGYETQNKYKVYEFNNGAKGGQMFKAKEDSNACERQCCGPQRGFATGLRYEHHNKGSGTRLSKILSVDGQIFDAAGNQLGELYHPFNCCTHTLEVKSPDGASRDRMKCEFIHKIAQLWYTITPGCCCTQLGMVCQCPCPACMEIRFPVYAGNTDRVVGEMMRHHPGCSKALITDADHFSMTFPKEANFAQRACLFGAVFIFDFLMFEQKQNNNNH